MSKIFAIFNENVDFFCGYPLMLGEVAPSYSQPQLLAGNLLNSGQLKI